MAFELVQKAISTLGVKQYEHAAIYAVNQRNASIVELFKKVNLFELCFQLLYTHPHEKIH